MEADAEENLQHKNQNSVSLEVLECYKGGFVHFLGGS